MWRMDTPSWSLTAPCSTTPPFMTRLSCIHIPSLIPIITFADNSEGGIEHIAFSSTEAMLDGDTFSNTYFFRK